MTTLTLICTVVTLVTTDPFMRVSEVRHGLTDCREATAVSWANIFRELDRAKACGTKPFRIGQCNG